MNTNTNKNTNTTNTAAMISGKSWTVRPVTIRQLETLLSNLPPVQRVRGSVWPSDVAEGLVSAVKEGLYVPPVVVVADGGNIDEAALVDGQQRSLSLVSAMKAGTLTGDESILLAMETGRTVEDAFSALNIGVPVGSALVSAMGIGGEVGEALVRLAAHPYFDSVKWSGIQGKRTERAAFAASVLAIFSGWSAPCSSAKDTADYIRNNTDLITAQAVEDSVRYLDDLAAAVRPHIEASAVKGKNGAPARALLAKLRRKNLFMTVTAAAAEGASAAACVAVMSRYDELLDGQEVTYTVKTPKGREVKRTATWAVGAGSSGSNSEFNERLVVFRAALARADEAPVAVANKAEAHAAADVSETPTADLEAALGIAVKEG